MLLFIIMITFIPFDIIESIIYPLNIVEKRLFAQTCKSYNKITKKYIHIDESQFYVRHFDKINNYSPEKFTLELCHYKYSHLIPNKYLHPNNTIIIKALAYYGNLSLLQKAIANNVPWDEYTIRWAAQNNNMDIIEWAYNNNCPIDDCSKAWLCSWAGYHGNLDMLKWGIHNGCMINEYIGLWAGHEGKLNVIIWLHNNKHEMHPNIITWAALNGHNNIIEWAIINNIFTLTKQICSFAAKNGHLSTLMLVKQYNCPWDNTTTTNAAQYGHLDVLKWCIHNGCPYDDDLIDWVKKFKNKKIINWLKHNI